MPVPHILEALLSGDFKSLWPPLAALLTGVYKGLDQWYHRQEDKFNPYKQAGQEIKQDLEKWLKDKYDDIVPSETQRIEEDVKQLLDEVNQWTSSVLKDIENTVNKGLDQGVIDQQTDGGLGQTRDIYTPDGDMPMDVGTIPGMGSEGGGMDRSGGGGSSSSAPSSSGSSSGGTQPLGSASPTGSGTPTPGDVGAGPGDFVEYQPGQVVITHPDGSQTVKPWPP